MISSILLHKNSIQILTSHSETMITHSSLYQIGRGIPKDSGAGNDQLESSSATVTLPRIPELEQKAEDSEETCKSPNLEFRTH